MRFGPPQTPDFLVHVCKNVKVTFCNFFIFRKFNNFLTFGQMIPRRLFTDVWELLFRSKRTVRTFPGKVHFPAPKRPMCSSPYVFRCQINVLRRGMCTFSKKCTFCTFSTLGTKKSCEFIDQTKGWRGHFENGELFAPRCSLEHLGTHWGPSRLASRLWPWPVATAVGWG